MSRYMRPQSGQAPASSDQAQKELALSKAYPSSNRSPRYAHVPQEQVQDFDEKRNEKGARSFAFPCLTDPVVFRDTYKRIGFSHAKMLFARLQNSAMLTART